VHAVLDTNVIISAAVTSDGVADRLLRLAALQRFTTIVSPTLLRDPSHRRQGLSGAAATQRAKIWPSSHPEPIDD
jgi:predicted nucleic acid-binding protein